MAESKKTMETEMTTDCLNIAGKTGGGVLGFISSKCLADVNGLLSALVAIVTIVYLSLSIAKKFSEIRQMREEKNEKQS